jgi:Ca-activated chloride channel homolog
LGKIYYGQQLVIFGRYTAGGEAEVTLKANLTGQDKTYTTHFTFPDQATGHPEIARLWAMNRVEAMQRQAMLGLTPAKEAQDAAKDLGIAYQIVTDETAMLVLSDAGFQRHGIQRANQERTAQEADAQLRRGSGAVVKQRVDQQQPMYQHAAPSLPHRGGFSGGGAFDWRAALGLVLATVVVAVGLRRQ